MSSPNTPESEFRSRFRDLRALRNIEQISETEFEYAVIRLIDKHTQDKVVETKIDYIDGLLGWEIGPEVDLDGRTLSGSQPYPAISDEYVVLTLEDELMQLKAQTKSGEKS